MLHIVVSLLLIVVFNDVCLVIAWDPSNFTFNPGDNYKLVWTEEFENVGPVKAIINGKPAYAPNPKNWAHKIGPFIDGGMQNYTDSIYNAYVQDGQLKIVALKEALTSAMLRGEYLQEFTFGVFAAKLRAPYGQGMWPAWWLVGNPNNSRIYWPTCGEIDILEMKGGNKHVNFTDQYAHGAIHWNNASNNMTPNNHRSLSKVWPTPDGSMLHNNSLVYWVEWTPTNISIGFNEFRYFVFNTTNIPDSINPVSAFDGKWPYYMVLNIAIGGAWPGPPDNTTVWPQEMVVDWIRIYQEKTTIITK
jgi:beta-glucanase (GH16 family)